VSDAIAACFDLDGTLTELDVSYAALVTGAFEDVLGTAPEAAVEAYGEAFFAAFQDLEPDPYAAGMARAVDAASLDADPAALADALVARELDAAVPTDGAAEFLESLPDAVPVGGVTNGVTAVQREKLARTGLASHVDALVTSYDAGAHKPAAAPFDAARERLAADAFVLVGDDHDGDVLGARNAGFDAVQIGSDGAFDSFAAVDWAEVRELAE
jgi:putative hydrolase of the HAD superfamily